MPTAGRVNGLTKQSSVKIKREGTVDVDMDILKKSAPHPRSRNTPKGGRMMAKMILMMSEHYCVSIPIVSAHNVKRHRPSRTSTCDKLSRS